VPDVYARTLRRAAEIVGGEEQLAAQLNVPPNWLSLWCRGLGAPTSDAFLAAVDIVVAHQTSAVARARPHTTK
jgi:DNA-binding transcriptional regulator YdaS (Cro superfamily)